MTTALVPVNPVLGPPPPVSPRVLVGPGRDRAALHRALTTLSTEAFFDGYFIVSAILDRTVLALQGARGTELATDLLLLLLREQLLEPADGQVIDCEGWDAA